MEATAKPKVSKKLYVLSEDEFREIFGLEKEYSISLNTRKQYSMYVKGSALMHKELYNMTDKKPLTMTFQGKREKIFCYVSDNKCGWQKWISPLGSPMRMECSYHDKHRGVGRKGSVPFWTYTKFNDAARQAAGMAYNVFTSELMRMRSEYSYKYRIEMDWRNMFEKYGDMHGPIWLDGCIFMNKLEVKNSKGIYEYIGDYSIKQTIHNRSNIWEGEILEPVRKIINSVFGKNEY